MSGLIQQEHLPVKELPLATEATEATEAAKSQASFKNLKRRSCLDNSVDQTNQSTLKSEQESRQKHQLKRELLKL